MNYSTPESLSVAGPSPSVVVSGAEGGANMTSEIQRIYTILQNQMDLVNKDLALENERRRNSLKEQSDIWEKRQKEWEKNRLEIEKNCERIRQELEQEYRPSPLMRKNDPPYITVNPLTRDFMVADLNPAPPSSTGRFLRFFSYFCCGC